MKFNSINLLKAAIYFSYFIFICSILTLPAIAQSTKILKLIPGNASMVFTVNGNSINKKVDFNKVKSNPTFRFLDSLAKLQLKGNYDILSRLYNKPADQGIDFSTNIYSFYRKSNNSANYFGGIFIPLYNKKKFEVFLSEASGNSLEGKIIKKRRYSYISEERFLFAWTRKYCMIVSKPNLYQGTSPELSAKLINKIIKQKSKHSILNNEDFMLSQKTNFDLAYWINYQSFFNQSLIQTFRTEDIAEDNKDFFTGNYVHNYINIDNGNLTYDSKFFINDLVTKKTKGTSEKKLNGELLKYIHKDSIIGLVSFSIDLREAQITVNENMRKSKEKFKSDLMANLFKDEFEKDSILIFKNHELNELNIKYHSTDTIPFTYTMPTQIEIETVPVSDSIKPEETKNDAVTYSYSYLDYDFLENLIKNKKNEIRSRKNELANNKLDELGYSENDIWDIFEGDILIGLTDIKYKETKYTISEHINKNSAPAMVEKTRKEILPEFIIAASIHKNVTAKKIIASLEKQGLIHKQGPYYKLIQGNSNYYLTISNNILIITNDEDLITIQPLLYSKNEELPADIEDHVLSNSFSMYLNAEKFISKIPRDNIHQLYNNLFLTKTTKLTPKGTFLSENLTAEELILNMVNKTNNSIYEIFRLINQFHMISIKR